MPGNANETQALRGDLERTDTRFLIADAMACGHRRRLAPRT